MSLSMSIYKKKKYLFLLIAFALSLSVKGFSYNNSSFFDKKEHEEVIQDKNYDEALKTIADYSSVNMKMLSSFQLKELALSYGVVKDSINSVKFVNRYIRQAHDNSILDYSEFDSIRSTSGFVQLIKKFKPTINGGIIFFISTGIIGVFISIVINLRKKGDIKGSALISLFVFFHSLLLIHISLNISKFSLNIPNSLFATTSFSLLYGPLLYFYFKRISNKYEFKKIDVLHLLPSAFLFIYLMPYYLLSPEEKLHILYNREGQFYNIVLLVVSLKYFSLIGYTLFIYKIFKKTKREKEVAEVWLWKRNIMILSTVYIVFYIIYSLSLIQLVKTNIFIYPQVLMMALIIIYVAYTAYVQPRVFSKKYIFNESLVKLKYQKSGLTNGFSEDLKEKLLQLLNSEKVYRNNEITLNILSEQLGTTRHNVSQVINEHFGVNFFQLINKFRIHEAIEIIKSDQNRNLKIIEIAYDVGFNNKVTFNKAFKIETSFTPSQYIDKMNKLGLA